MFHLCLGESLSPFTELYPPLIFTRWRIRQSVTPDIAGRRPRVSVSLPAWANGRLRGHFYMFVSPSRCLALTMPNTLVLSDWHSLGINPHVFLCTSIFFTHIWYLPPIKVYSYPAECQGAFKFQYLTSVSLFLSHLPSISLLLFFKSWPTELLHGALCLLSTLILTIEDSSRCEENTSCKSLSVHFI